MNSRLCHENMTFGDRGDRITPKKSREVQLTSRD